MKQTHALRNFLFGCALLAAVTTAKAQVTRAWDGGGNTNWNTTTNWNPDGSPTNNDITFSGSTGDWPHPFWDSRYTGTNGWLIHSGATALTGFSNLQNATANWTDAQGDFFNAELSGSGFTFFSERQQYLPELCHTRARSCASGQSWPAGPASPPPLRSGFMP